MNMSLKNMVKQWMNVNKLKMNAEKTKYTIVRSVRKEQRNNVILRGSDGIKSNVK